MNYLLANTSLFSYIMLVFLSSCCYNSNNESIYIDYATLKPDITSRNNHIDNDCTYWIDENYGDDDDDDEQSPILPNERQQEFRTLMEELGNQCNCTIPEYNQIDEFISTKMEKTTFYRNLLTLTSIINNDNLWVLKHIFVFCPFIPFDNFLPTDNETLCFAIPPDLLHSISLKKCLFNSGMFTLSTIAVFKNRENDETRVVVISNNDGNIYYDSLNDFKPITCPDKIITDSSIMTSITTITSAICEFEKKHVDFGPACFESFFYFENGEEIDKYLRNIVYSSSFLKTPLTENLPCWLVKANTYQTLSREHLPKMMWTGTCWDFVISSNDIKVKYVRRTR